MTNRVRHLNVSGTFTLPGVSRLERVIVGNTAVSSFDFRVGTTGDVPFVVLDGVQGSYEFGIDVPPANTIEVVVGNVSTALSASSSSDDILIDAGHGLSDGDHVAFTALTGGAGLETKKTYFVVNATTGTFQLAETAGGTPIDFTTDISAATYEQVADVTVVYK